MSNVLFAWELGGGLGHLARMKPYVEQLVRRGASVTVAVRDLSRADMLGADLQLMQAPWTPHRPPGYLAAASTFAHVLHNSAFGDERTLRNHLQAWLHIFALSGVQLVICDHAPTALLAARIARLPTVITGSGFCCPATSPWPAWRPESNATPQQLAAHQQQVLERVNRILTTEKAQPLHSLCELYTTAELTLLHTFASLDPFPQRAADPDTHYLGVHPQESGATAEWPAGAGRRAFVYLKPFAQLPTLLTALSELQLTTLLYIPRLDETIRRRFTSPLLQFATEPLNLQQVARECDFSVSHGGHGVAATMMLAGKPQFFLPIVLEQRLTAEVLESKGAAMTCNPRDTGAIPTKLSQLLSSTTHCNAAQELAARHDQATLARNRAAAMRKLIKLLP